MPDLNLETVDVPEPERNKLDVRRFWDQVWKELRRLPPGKAIKLPLALLIKEAPLAVGKEGRFTYHSWDHIQGKLDYRATKDKMDVALCHSWGSAKLAESTEITIWMEMIINGQRL